VDATHDFLSPEDRAAIDPEAEAYLLSAPLWVAVNPAGRLLAFMSFGEGRLDSLFVDPQYRGSGIGRALVAHAAASHPVLDTEVNAQNAQAVGFYRKVGFVEIGYSQADDKGRPYPLIRMRLGPSAG
jgi:putative acetyltransferase